MDINQYRANISAQINQQAITTLIDSFAAQSAEFDKVKEELAALKATIPPCTSPPTSAPVSPA